MYFLETQNLIARVYAIKIHKRSMLFSLAFILLVPYIYGISNMAHIMASTLSLFIWKKYKQTDGNSVLIVIIFDIFISFIYINICWACYILYLNINTNAGKSAFHSKKKEREKITNVGINIQHI